MGVVKDVSPVFKEAAGRCLGTDHRTGGLHRKAVDRNAPATEQRRLSGPGPGRSTKPERRFNLANKPWTLSLNAPYSHRTHTMGVDKICL
ncbi:MAG: hypothetical protein ACLR8Y_09520 [Alistipes indistinctus]